MYGPSIHCITDAAVIVIIDAEADDSLESEYAEHFVCVMMALCCLHVDAGVPHVSHCLGVFI